MKELLLLAGIYYLWTKRGGIRRDDPEEEEVASDCGPLGPGFSGLGQFKLGEALCPTSYEVLRKAYDPYSELLQQAAVENNIPDPKIISAIIWKESHGDQNAEGKGKDPNYRGMGLMQITYGTAKWLGYKGSREQLKDPTLNIQWGTKLLGQLLKKHNNNLSEALQKYRGHKKSSVNAKYANHVIEIHSILQQ